MYANYTYRIEIMARKKTTLENVDHMTIGDLIEDFTEDFCILKTVWIRIFQRKFRNWLKKKRKLMAPKKYNEATNHWKIPRISKKNIF